MFRKCALVVCLLSLSAWSQPAARPGGIAGEWNGAIAGKLRVIVRVDRAADGSLHGSLESVDQGHVKLDIDEVAFDGKKSVRFEMKKIAAAYDAELNADGSEMSGTWQQSGAMVPLTLRRPDAPPAKTLQPSVRGSMSLDPCPAGQGLGLCGTYQVYKNRAARSSRKIALHVMILPALAEKPATDPVFGFAGDNLIDSATGGGSHGRMWVVIIPKGTHLTASACIDNMIVQFVNQASASDLDTACVNQIRHLPFLRLQQTP